MGRNLAEGGFRLCSVRPLTPSVMAHPSTPLFLLAAVAFAAPDALATPVQGLRGAISNSTGKARPAQTFLPQVMTWSREESHVASMETTSQIAISITLATTTQSRFRIAGIKWMGQAQRCTD